MIECDGPLAVVLGPNSKGKSSLVEGIEFLLTGRTTRVQLHGGSSSEFAQCLRNVHLSPGEEVYVEAVVENGGVRQVVRRTLDEDLSSNGECGATLTIDGAPAEGSEAIGLALSPAPFEAPVLMQHALRYALSAKPQSRAEYLKAVLDISDLDEIREIIATQLKAIDTPSTPALDRLRSCQRHSALSTALRDVDPSSPATVREGLSNAIRDAIGAPAETGLTELVDLLRAELERRQQAVFPTASLQVQPPSAPTWPTFASLQESIESAEPESLDESPAVLDLLNALITVPHILETDKAIDCPVCHTRDALTPGRLAEIRGVLEGAHKRREVAAAARTELDASLRSAAGLVAALEVDRPAGLAWSPEEQQRQAEAAERLLPGEGATAIKGLLEVAVSLAAPRTRALGKVERVVELSTQALTSLRSGMESDVDALRSATREANDELVALAEAEHAYARQAQGVLARLDATLAQAAATQGWAELLLLAADYELIPPENRQSEAHTALLKEAEAARRSIDKARSGLLDSNFKALSKGIGRWWNLLRPDEPIRFSKIKRRGAGMRHVDLTALLSPERSSQGVERHAAGVFSDSQLNALGLSIFLARTARAGAGFVVLDDPVPASDDEHRGAFARAVIEALIQDGVQVLVTTHDRNLNKRIHDLHSHVGIDGYHVAMDTPGEGASLIRRTDDLRSILDEAFDYTRHCLDSQLPEAANKVRKATERLCKEIVVKAQRADGKEMTTADLNANPADLVKMATPLLTKDSSHPGKLKHAITVTNPGSHDDPIGAARQDLTGVMGDLKRLRKDYCG